MDKKLKMLLTLYRAYTIYKKYRGYYDFVQTGVNLASGTYVVINNLMPAPKKEKELNEKEILDSYVIVGDEDSEYPDG